MSRCHKIKAVARSLPLALACGLSQFAYPWEVLAQPLPAISPAIYPYYLDPTTYPDYTRRPLPVADWSVYQNQPQFVGVRGGTMDEAYFTSRWQPFRFTFTPTNSGVAILKIENVDCDATVLLDDLYFKQTSGSPELLPNSKIASGTNWLANPGFETRDPGQGWVRTAGVNVYQDGHNSRHSMLLRAGHSLLTTVNLQAGQVYQTTVWLSIAGRSRGRVQLSVGAPTLGSATLSVAEETTRNPSGLVYWPNVSTVVNGLTGAELNAMTNHGVILHDLGGYGPGEAWTGSYGQALASTNAVAAIANKLGNHYTGADIGEQDARFANVFEAVHEPFSLTDNFQNYQVAHRYLGQVGDDLGNIMCLLVNLWFWHYPVKDAHVLAVGAQAQPKEGIANSQVHYSFLRGAGKQYGVPWFGNASVFSTDWDRGGPQPNYKTYPTQATNGSSLNLMRRLMFTHYLYGCSSLSFEGSWRTDA